ncbi:Transcriptional regulator [Giardia duodenalis]|uniref:Transcriptional regulator n=1 Tax=Giardia intestinalis TaxID=5741 RepID=V6TQQ1_GIAIN|nr:Transcriptional regulator [Giardia intestinalis]
MQNRFFGFKKKLSSSHSTKLTTTNKIKIITKLFLL